MTTRLTKGGRPPKTRDAMLEAILARPGEGLTSTRLAEIVGCTSTAACDNLRVLRARGFVTWLSLDRRQLHFAPGPYKDLYAAAHKAGLSSEEATLAGIMEQRRARVIQMLGVGLPLGLSAMEMAAELGVQAGSMRHLLRSMAQAGEVFAGGSARKVRWFVSKEARDAAKPALDALEAEHAERTAAVLREGHKAAAEARRAKAKPKKPKDTKPRKMNRACGVSLATRSERTRPAPERVPVEIIGMDEALKKCKPAEKYPDHKYAVPDTHRGAFSSLRIGQYLPVVEPQT